MQSLGPPEANSACTISIGNLLQSVLNRVGPPAFPVSVCVASNCPVSVDCCNIGDLHEAYFSNNSNEYFSIFSNESTLRGTYARKADERNNLAVNIVWLQRGKKQLQYACLRPIRMYYLTQKQLQPMCRENQRGYIYDSQ